MLKNLWRALAPNPLDRLLSRAQKKQSRSILLFWNRGLGDIALGLYTIIQRIRDYLPHAKITFLTRANLSEGFALLPDIEVILSPRLQRGDAVCISSLLREVRRCIEEFDLVIEKPDPTYWVHWQLGKVIPQLTWPDEKEDLWKTYPLQPGKRYIGAHVQTETNYGNRDWPIAHWQELFDRLSQRGEQILLFGFAKTPLFSLSNLIDLRGETSLFQLLCLIKNCCHTLIAPDSGISSMTYFLSTQFPLRFISLWGNPDMGILKQNVASPNLLLEHIPLIGAGQQIASISPELVEGVLLSHILKENNPKKTQQRKS